MKVRRILASSRAEISLLIGNGINQAAGVTGGISWDKLMETLVDEAAERAAKPAEARHKLRSLLVRNAQGQRAASLPEIFDVIEAVGTIAPDAAVPATKPPGLQARLAALFRDMRPGVPHEKVVAWAQRQQVPILTTNYDHCLQDAVAGLRCKQFRLKNGRAQSDYYPWDRYYSTAEITDPVKSFAIWHIHGDRALQRSIRAGLDQYMGMVERLRKLKRPVAREILSEPPADPARTPSYFAAPWLRIFMGRKLWIQGLGLHSDEVSLRWLLIQRFRLWRSFKPDEAGATGWYAHGPTEVTGALDTGRRVFFESVGLQVIEIEKRKEMYEKLFGEGPTSGCRGKSKLRGTPQASSPGTASHSERVVTLQGADHMKR